MECDGNMDATCNMQHVVDRHYAWETGTWDVGRGTWDVGWESDCLGVLGMLRRFTLHVHVLTFTPFGDVVACVCKQAVKLCLPFIASWDQGSVVL